MLHQMLHKKSSSSQTGVLAAPKLCWWSAKVQTNIHCLRLIVMLLHLVKFKLVLSISEQLYVNKKWEKSHPHLMSAFMYDPIPSLLSKHHHLFMNLNYFIILDRKITNGWNINGYPPLLLLQVRWLAFQQQSRLENFWKSFWLSFCWDVILVLI